MSAQALYTVLYLQAGCTLDHDPLVWQGWADDAEHACEQFANAEPHAVQVFCWPTNDADEALARYWADQVSTQARRKVRAGIAYLRQIQRHIADDQLLSGSEEAEAVRVLLWELLPTWREQLEARPMSDHYTELVHRSLTRVRDVLGTVEQQLLAQMQPEYWQQEA